MPTDPLAKAERKAVHDTEMIRLSHHHSKRTIIWWWMVGLFVAFMLVLTYRTRTKPIYIEKAVNAPELANAIRSGDTMGKITYMGDPDRREDTFSLSLWYIITNGIPSYAYGYTISNDTTVIITLPVSDWELGPGGLELRPKKK